jgi:DNA replication protein DnaC
VKECECRKALREEIAIVRAGIPERYRTKTLESYDTKQSPSAFEAHGLARRFIETWPMDRGLSMLLTGSVGLGKTHLATAILMECRKRYNATIRFVDLPELLTRIKATFGGDTGQTEETILRPLLAADILAIDEIGAARSTEWAFAMTENIINVRYNANASTIYTTNFANLPPAQTMRRESGPGQKRNGTLDPVPDLDFAARLSRPLEMPVMRQETLGDRIGERMFSRLQEMCWVIEMSGQDQRRAKVARGRK